MSTGDDAFFNWSVTTTSAPASTTDYQRRLCIRYQQDGTGAHPKGDPFAVLGGLGLLPEDKAYLHGFIGALQLPEHIQHGLLLEYRQRWEKAEQRAIHPNRAVNSGRRSANIWIQQGAKGFIHWQ